MPMLAGLLAAALVLAPQTPAADVPAISERVWAKPDHFWYRRTVPGGHLWLTVDAKHGAKSPLFDHQRLAIELNLRTGYDYTPLTLPFADPAARFAVKYDGANAYIQEGAMAVEFVLDGRQWRCELQIKWDWNKVPPTDYECLPRGQAGTAPAAVAAGTAANPLVSPDGALEAFVENHNVAVRPAGGGAATVLTTDGTNGDAYDSGSLRWSGDSRTLSACRLNAAIWQSDGVSGNVEKLIVARTLPAGR
ncbi:MAG TPA: hypothetical protein VMN81_04680 [Vicinamibacterales bacterium]|nr:hypothetical protein [Vicinamibacterales bacterium]